MPPETSSSDGSSGLRVLRALVAWESEGEKAMKHYQIFVTGKQGIFDPAGKTAQNALDNLGYKGVADLKIGKFIQLSCDESVSRQTVTEMCEKLLANPIIEDFRIEELSAEGTVEGVVTSATAPAPAEEAGA
jgi:phosphoribosylformylglycinamidine synthase